MPANPARRNTGFRFGTSLALCKVILNQNLSGIGYTGLLSSPFILYIRYVYPANPFDL